MNEIQTVLVGLLSVAIRSKKTDVSSNEATGDNEKTDILKSYCNIRQKPQNIRGNISDMRMKLFDTDIWHNVNWKKVYEEAKAHQVQSLLYPLLKKMPYSHKMDEKLFSEWRRDAILTGIIQTQHINQIKKVLEALSKENIEVILLKGLVVRKLYPHPELRRMCDADLLARKQDVEHIKNVLFKMGYEEHNITPAHIHFKHANHLSIELHWTLSDERYISDISGFEKNIWQNAVCCNLYDTPCMMLSPTDMAIHLCLHMATHAVSSGFGLRQLCDLVLYVEANRNLIDWDAFIKGIKACGIERFTKAVFLSCRRLFDMENPKEISCEDISSGKNLDLFIDDIFSGGVYGRKSLARALGNEVVQGHDSVTGSSLARLSKGFLAILFPPAGKLTEKYTYARKVPALIPIAWVHHLICGIFSKDYKFIDKLLFFILTMPVSRRRAKLLHWLELL